MNEGLQIAAGMPPLSPEAHGLKSLAAFERDYIEFVIGICSGNIPQAAKILDVSPSTLYRKQAHWEQTQFGPLTGRQT